MCAPTGSPLASIIFIASDNDVQIGALRGLRLVPVRLCSHPSSSTAALVCVSVSTMEGVEGMITGSPLDWTVWKLALLIVSKVFTL